MSQRGSNYERRPHDFYATPAWCTHALIPHLPERRGGLVVWEPACGNGDMVNALSQGLRGALVYGTDIQQGVDFLATTEPVFSCQAIITNPPYHCATQFIEHALRLMEPVGGVVAMLLRSDFAHAKSRQHLFRDSPCYAKKVELLKRIVWFAAKPGERGKSPSENHCWQIWDCRHEGPPTIAFGP